MYFLTKGGTGGPEATGPSKGTACRGWDLGLLGRAVCVICLPLLREGWKPVGMRLFCMRLSSRQPGRDTDLFTVSPARHVTCECMGMISI